MWTGFHFSGVMPKSAIARLHCKHMYGFRRNSQTVVHSMPAPLYTVFVRLIQLSRVILSCLYITGHFSLTWLCHIDLLLVIWESLFLIFKKKFPFYFVKQLLNWYGYSVSDDIKIWNAGALTQFCFFLLNFIHDDLSPCRFNDFFLVLFFVFVFGWS